MGASSPKEDKYIVWMDKNVKIEENKNYLAYFEKKISKQ